MPISEKVFSQQLRELVAAGLIRRISYDTVPPKVEYVLTPSGEQLIPALDILYIWSIRRMNELDIPIDANAFTVHKSGKYVDALRDIMEANHFWPASTIRAVELRRRQRQRNSGTRAVPRRLIAAAAFVSAPDTKMSVTDQKVGVAQTAIGD